MTHPKTALIASVIALAGCSSDRPKPPSGLSTVATPVTSALPPPADARVAVVVPDAAPLFSAPIVDWPIPWPPERQRLMLEYRQQHTDPAATDLTITPTIIVLHYTAGPSAKGTHRYFSNLEIEPGRTQLRAAGVVNVSSHFLVDLDGTIYRLVPETTMARHCIGLNHNSIGIENVGDEQKVKLTDAQVAANIALVRHLAARYPIKRVIGHMEARKLDGTPEFVELDPKFRNVKGDPGLRFLNLVRAGIADLGLAGVD